MKKRSLFAAVAMLIVSAVVLTSATYAWFASGSNAYVESISATITNSDGSILLSADGGTTWLSTIGQGNFTNATGSFSSAYAPVSVTPAATPIVVGGQLDGSNFTGAAATAGTQYTQFTYKLKTTVDANVTCTPAFSTAVAYGYALVIVNGTTYLYGNDTTRTYYPIATAADPTTIAGVDSNNNFVMDSGDTSCPTLGGIQQPTNAGSIAISTTANNPVDITVLIWAEGQDLACNGTVNAQEIGIAFSFAK